MRKAIVTKCGVCKYFDAERIPKGHTHGVTGCEIWIYDRDPEYPYRLENWRAGDLDCHRFTPNDARVYEEAGKAFALAAEYLSLLDDNGR